MTGVSADWRARVYAVVRSIPRGRVASYGLVAMLAGRSGAARAVGNAMLECDDASVPCHRVVHADGSLAPSFGRQRERLRREGVSFVGGRVDVRERLWTPRLPAADARGARGAAIRAAAPVRSARRGERAAFGGSGGRSRWMMRKDSPAL
jgi:methylated-DNA-protein-cysteine methyltransferase-like protein